MNKNVRLSTTEPILIVKLNQKYRPGMSTEDLYDISRQYWIVGTRRNKVKYVVAAYCGWTIEAYLVENWYPVEHQGKTRWAFHGAVANDAIREKLVHKSIGHLQVKGAANPVRYLNCHDKDMARPRQTHSTEREGKRYIWYTERLWRLAKDLPVYDVDIERFAELDRDCWFGEGRTPTIREVADHCRRINETDPEFPVIINDNGRLMDGGHRLARALLEGRKTVKAVRFEEMPEPDEVEEILVDDNLGLWSARLRSHSWFRNELKCESDLLHQGFYLLYQCISLYNRILSNPKNLSDPFVEVCALTTVKAQHLIFGIYNMTIDGIAQESGALLRPLIETCDLLKYVRVKPDSAVNIRNGKKPSAGEIGKRIESDFQGLRNHLNKNASHLSFSEDSIRHLRDSESGFLKFIPTHGRIVLQRNLSTVNAFLTFLLFESISCLGYVGMDINELADKVEQWRDESYTVNLKA